MSRHEHRREHQKGYIQLRGKVWVLQIRVDSKGKRIRAKLRLGTTRELPTREDAEKAAAYVHAVGPDNVYRLLRSRHASERKNLPVFTGEWFADKLTEQEGRCAICRQIPKRLVVDPRSRNRRAKGATLLTVQLRNRHAPR